MLLPDLDAIRNDFANSVCWSLMVMMNLGELEDIPLAWRPFIAEDLQPWARIALCELPSAEPITDEDYILTR